MKTAKTDAFWNLFKKEQGQAAQNYQDYEVVAFGDSPEMQNELAGLVLSGEKRATAGLARDFGEASPLPRAGDFVIVVNGGGEPCCIYRSTDVRVGPLNSVDDAFAWDEGEGHRSRQWWLSAHYAFFSRQAKAEGFEMRDDIETVFERFTLVWPPEAADR